MPQNADVILRDVHLVTFDPEQTVIPGGALAIRDGVILERGPARVIAERWEAAEEVDGGGQLAIPGLTDAHFHTAQTLMRGMITSLQAEGRLRVPTWREYYLPFEAALSPEDVELSGELAYATMLRSGTTQVMESGGPHPEAMARAAQRAGIRATVAVSTMDGGSRIPPSMIMTTDEAIARNIEVAEAFPTDPGGANRVTGGMALRQVITCSPDLVTAVHSEARARGVKVHTHLVEGTYEIDFCLEKYGRRPIEYLLDLGVFDSTLHCAHSILTSDSEVGLFAEHRASACHCAKGNYAIGAAPALRMWRRGVDIGIGSDGVATLGTLDIFRIAMLTRIGQQFLEGTSNHNRNGVDANEPLAMAAIGGARASGNGDHVGTLEVGKRADVVLVSMDGPEAAGYTSPEAFLYESASGRDVTTVLVDGRVVVRDRDVLTLDYADVRARAAVRQRDLISQIA